MESLKRELFRKAGRGCIKLLGVVQDPGASHCHVLFPSLTLKKREGGEVIGIWRHWEFSYRSCRLCLKDEDHLWQPCREEDEEKNNQLILLPSFPLTNPGGYQEGKGAWRVSLHRSVSLGTEHSGGGWRVNLEGHIEDTIFPLLAVLSYQV